MDLSGFDLMVAHPPCTHLASSGARWFKDKRKLQWEALAFVRWLLAAPVPRIALENPVGVIATRVRPPDQIVQPWWFGDPETKTTCWWLKNLPPLRATEVVEPDYMRRPDGSYYRDSKGKRYSRIHFESGRKDPEERWRRRSRFYTGMATAMATQWGTADWIQEPIPWTAPASPSPKVPTRRRVDCGIIRGTRMGHKVPPGKESKED